MVNCYLGQNIIFYFYLFNKTPCSLSDHLGEYYTILAVLYNFYHEGQVVTSAVELG